ncbi:MAG: tail fiber domain-containing protein, partial [Chitinophagales bacterium]|nr:tail fiber domain-containing protein [Chitinophagales bacterium]
QGPIGPTGPGTQCATATTNFVSKFTTSGVDAQQCNSLIQDNGTAVSINGNIQNNKMLKVYGAVSAASAPCSSFSPNNASNFGFVFDNDGDSGFFAVDNDNTPVTMDELRIYLNASEKLRFTGNRAHFGNEVYSTNGFTTSTGFLACSDERFKKDFRQLCNVLEQISLVNGYYYKWRTDEFPEKQFNDKNQIGFKAQEIEKIFPEVVTTDEQGYKSVDYGKLTPVLLEAIKQLHHIIETQNEEISKLKASAGEVELLKQDLELIKKIVYQRGEK